MRIKLPDHGQIYDSDNNFKVKLKITMQSYSLLCVLYTCKILLCGFTFWIHNRRICIFWNVTSSQTPGPWPNLWLWLHFKRWTKSNNTVLPATMRTIELSNPVVWIYVLNSQSSYIHGVMTWRRVFVDPCRLSALIVASERSPCGRDEKP